MDQTDRNHKKKYNPSELPSVFMSPESPGDHQFGRLTPCFGASTSTLSSCFLTPPSSQEKDWSPQPLSISIQGLPKLNFELEYGDREESNKHSLQRSPLLPEDRIIGRLIGKESIDFVADLLGFDFICQKICSYLEPSDLCSFASVSPIWRNFVKQNSQVHERWRKFLEECKQHFVLKGQENRGTPHFQKSSSFDDLVRLPLKSINLNIPHKKEHNELTLASASSELQIQHYPVTRQAGNELRLCPKCTSPSNLSKTQEGHCTCQKCGLRYCSVCLRDTAQHTGSKKCDGLSTGPSRNDSRLRSRILGKDIVGSKRTKDRLRRL